MADVTIPQLPVATELADDDKAEVVDFSDKTSGADGTSKHSTLLLLRTWLQGFFAQLSAINDFTANQRTTGGWFEQIGGTFRQVLNPYRGAQIAEVGYTGTPTTVASGGTFTPGTDATGNQMIEFTGTDETTIADMTVSTSVEAVVPDGLTLTINGAYQQIGQQTGGRANRIIFTRLGSLRQAVWI